MNRRTVSQFATAAVAAALAAASFAFDSPAPTTTPSTHDSWTAVPSASDVEAEMPTLQARGSVGPYSYHVHVTTDDFQLPGRGSVPSRTATNAPAAPAAPGAPSDSRAVVGPQLTSPDVGIARLAPPESSCTGRDALDLSVRDVLDCGYDVSDFALLTAAQALRDADAAADAAVEAATDTADDAIDFAADAADRVQARANAAAGQAQDAAIDAAETVYEAGTEVVDNATDRADEAVDCADDLAGSPLEASANDVIDCA